MGITFAYEWSGWLLFLLIPAFLLTLIPYFRLNKRYRRTRNRIISVVLHCVIMTLCICVLSGMVFLYDVTSDRNEIILLVDASFSGREAEESKDAFIRSVLDSAGSGFRIGVVTFGFDQVEAVPLTDRLDTVYDAYKRAEKPDDSATDIASALFYARDLLTYPATAKIVLITDGIETDGDALTAVRTIASEGVKVDTKFFPNRTHDEVEILDVAVPDYNIAVGATFKLGVTLQSSYEGVAELRLFDNDEPVQSISGVQLVQGLQTCEFEHTFEEDRLHSLRVELTADGNAEDLNENNVYHTYIYLNHFTKILVIERNDDESQELVSTLAENEEAGYEPDVVNITNADEMPTTLEGLRQYDQIFLVNIANADMPDGFDELLHQYVNQYGGGLFTVGGNKVDESTGETVANAYNRNDMLGTLYQQMLPVQAINYTPPLGLMIIIDRSGSMSTPDKTTGRSLLQLAKDGALACLNSLSERDFCGVMSLEDDYTEDIAMVPVPQRSQIRAAIDNIPEDGGGGTVFTGAIERAGLALSALDKVEKRHIILVTDGEPADTIEEFGARIQYFYERSNITFSAVTINATASAESLMRQAAELGGGRCHATQNPTELTREMREDLMVPEIKESSNEPFTPEIRDHTAVVSGIDPATMPQLGGFYGTKAKEGVAIPLAGEYVPIYAQWKFGKGTVGSFMCDLNGTWSGEFLASETGKQIIYNIVNNLFPTEDVKEHSTTITLTEDNYSTTVRVDAKGSVGEKEKVHVTVISETDPLFTAMELDLDMISPTADSPASATSYGSTKIVLRDPGVYTVNVVKLNEAGAVIEEYNRTVYRNFSYSAEYDTFVAAEDSVKFLGALADGGKGANIEEPYEIFEKFDRLLHLQYDPRLLFIIIALVLFLLDIAVRKFKFKWPHEIYRDYKMKKEMGK